MQVSTAYPMHLFLITSALLLLDEEMCTTLYESWSWVFEENTKEGSLHNLEAVPEGSGWILVGDGGPFSALQKAAAGRAEKAFSLLFQRATQMVSVTLCQRWTLMWCPGGLLQLAVW